MAPVAGPLNGLVLDVRFAVRCRRARPAYQAGDQDDSRDVRRHGEKFGRDGRLQDGELLLQRIGETEDQRRQVPGLHPDRAPTIVAGMILLSEAMGAFDLAAVEVSEHDILRGGALRLAGLG